MGCFAIFLNGLFPGLGTLAFTNKTGQGFIQLTLAVANDIIGLFLFFITLGFWGIIWFIIHTVLATWALATTISFMSEQAARKAVREAQVQLPQSLNPEQQSNPLDGDLS
jgi:hypothetical protein